MVRVIFLCTWIGISILNAASFDCSKASSHVDKMICSDAEISSLDSKLGRIYRSVLKSIPSINIDDFKDEGKIWIKKRNKCKNGTCLVDLYTTRISYLQAYPPHHLPGVYEVTSQELNIRDNPNKASNILGRAKRGDKVDVYEFFGKWGRTKYGWISGKHLKPVHGSSHESSTQYTRSKSQLQPLPIQVNVNQHHRKTVNNEGKFQYTGNTSANKTSASPIQKVIVTGMGLNENKAIRNATKTAIQQVVGMYVVSDTMMKNSKIIKDEVLTQSNAYVKSFKTLNKTKDEDGLFEIEAEVEVEVGKLTRTLSKLNIAVKGVGSDQLKAKALTNFSSMSDFKAMVQKVIIEPIKKNNIYEIKIHSFDVENEDVPNLQSEGRTQLTEASLVPFKLNFSMTLSENYINSIEMFLDKAAKESFDENKRNIKNAIRIYRFTGLKPSSGSKLLKVTKILKKLYVLSSRNFQIYQKQIKPFKSRKDLKIKISVLDSQNSLIKRFIYLTDTPNMKPKDRTPIFIDNKYYSSYTGPNFLTRTYLSAMSMTDRGRSGQYLEGIPHFRDDFHILGNQELFTYLYLNEEEASKISTIKITTSWE